eukprot:NODE_495_length_6825_cov_1.481267.p4 type:complete len:133 gc:universal NODE_495_length_6825_cov_1.481267:4760-4362(-)
MVVDSQILVSSIVLLSLSSRSLNKLPKTSSIIIFQKEELKFTPRVLSESKRYVRARVRTSRSHFNTISWRAIRIGSHIFVSWSSNLVALQRSRMEWSSSILWRLILGNALQLQNSANVNKYSENDELSISSK